MFHIYIKVSIGLGKPVIMEQKTYEMKEINGDSLTCFVLENIHIFSTPKNETLIKKKKKGKKNKLAYIITHHNRVKIQKKKLNSYICEEFRVL